MPAPQRIDRLADVDGGYILDEFDLAGFRVDFDFGSTGGKKPESGRALLAVFVFDGGFYLPFTDQGSALHAEPLEHDFSIIQRGFRQADLAIGETDLLFRDAVFFHDRLF